MAKVAANVEHRAKPAQARRACTSAVCPTRTAEAAAAQRMPSAESVHVDGTVEGQAARLSDARLPLGQRRDFAMRIGHAQGNLHLRKVVASLRADPASPEQEAGVQEHAGPAAVPHAASPEAEGGAAGTSTEQAARAGSLQAAGTAAAGSAAPGKTKLDTRSRAGAPERARETGDRVDAEERRPEPASRRHAESAPAGEGAANPKGDAPAIGGSAVAHASAANSAAGGDGKAGGAVLAGAGPALDSSSAEGLLASLAASPVSNLAQALSGARALAPELQQREKAQVQASIPAIDAPTGLPAVAQQAPKPATALPESHAAEPPLATGRATSPEVPRAPETAAPLPANRVSTATAEPKDADADDGGGGWWNWLTGRLQGFFGSLPTSDPNVSTSAGQQQRVDTSGDADPAQNAAQQQNAEHDVAGRRTAADAASHADFGENDVYPNLPPARLRAAYKPAPPPRPEGKAPQRAPALPAKEHAEFDRSAKPWLDEQVHEQLGSYDKEHGRYERASEDAQKTGKRQLEEETKRTRDEQLALRKDVHADVAAERGRWQEENRKITEKVGSQSSSKRQEIDRQIKEKITSTHRDADAQLQEAETKAETEKAKSEKEAADKKREAEDQPRSWWDRVKGAVSDVFNAIRSAVNAIFDKLRQLVKGIIDAARRAVHALIEVCRAAIVGMIHAFGAFVKGLVSVALAAFPELAKKARAWIDGKVKAATDAVNRAAAALHRAADAILDAVAKAVDMALGILQAAFLKALDVLEKLALLPFQAMEMLAKLVEWMAKYGKFVTGALDLEGLADQVIAGLKKSIGGMIEEVPGKAYSKLQALAGQLGGGVPATAVPATAKPATGAPLRVQREPAQTPAQPAKRHVSASDHVKGVLRHLDKGLEHLKTHWWDELKKVGWNLLWPWPAVWGDLKDIWKQIKTGFDDAYHLRASKVIDDILAVDQKINSILGNLYGWFFIASVLVGTIIGAFFGGAGAIPGALAGAAFAGEVGEALVVALIATESAVIVKSVADLAIGNDKPEDDETDYGKIGGSTLTIAITLAMMLLGEIAAKLAKSVWESVAGVFRGEKGPEVRVDAGEGAGKPGAEGGEGDLHPGTEGGGRALAEAPMADGSGTVKALEDGRTVICRMCEISDLAKEFAAELDDPARASDPDIQNLKTEIENAKTLDPAAKVKAEVELRAKLDKLRAESPAKSKAAPSKTADPLHGRTPEEFDALASDPAHGGKIDAKSIQERRVGLDLEARGDVPGPLTRDLTGGAEFIDSAGQKWDVKGFNSNFPPKKGGFELVRDAGKVDKSLALGENVMLDTSNMSPTDIQALRTEGTQRGWGNRVKWWP